MTLSNPSLVGNFLIAMPNLADPNFWQSVVLLGVHSDQEGAFGLIVNRELEVNLREILSELGDTVEEKDLPEVLAGGPVQPNHGFVLFERGKEDIGEGDITVSDSLVVSGNTETLSRLAHGEAGSRYYLLLGYSGWQPGQLEQEIEDNSWIVAPLDSSILFEVPAEDRWVAALQSIGVEPGNLVDLGSSEPS